MHELDRLYAFFKKRNGHGDTKLCLVNAQQIGGGKQNYCLTTAEDNSQSMGYGLISGWLALPSKIQGNDWQKQFTQHWWNFDLNLQKHLDFSPNIEDGALYIQDDEITNFISKNSDRLSSHVASSIIMKNNLFYAVDYGDNGYRFHDLEKLSTDQIFYFQTIECHAPGSLAIR